NCRPENHARRAHKAVWASAGYVAALLHSHTNRRNSEPPHQRRQRSANRGQRRRYERSLERSSSDLDSRCNVLFRLAADAYGAGYFVTQGYAHITGGNLAAVIALQKRLFFPLSALMSTQVEVVSSFALFDRIFEYLDLPQDITDRRDAIDMSHDDVRGEVEF